MGPVICSDSVDHGSIGPPDDSNGAGIVTIAGIMPVAAHYEETCP